MGGLVPQVAACMGKEGDATPFTDVTVDNISIALQKCGYQSRGWEVGVTLHGFLCFRVRSPLSVGHICSKPGATPPAGS